MKRTSMLKPDLEERSFGSVYDPLLSGVAQGLARLFPPVDKVRAADAEPDRRQEARRSGEERRETRARS